MNKINKINKDFKKKLKIYKIKIKICYIKYKMITKKQSKIYCQKKLNKMFFNKLKKLNNKNFKYKNQNNNQNYFNNKIKT